jgi:hypothetical protein
VVDEGRKTFEVGTATAIGAMIQRLLVDLRVEVLIQPG